MCIALWWVFLSADYFLGVQNNRYVKADYYEKISQDFHFFFLFNIIIFRVSNHHDHHHDDWAILQF